jgi:hypothetical protein
MSRGQFLRAGVSALVGFLLACVHTPDSYPVPEQHRPFRSWQAAATEFVSVADPESDRFLISGFQPREPGILRWTKAEPELQFELASVGDRVLVYEFVVNDKVLREAGPLTLEFFVNDHLISCETYDSPGEKRFEAKIPAGLLRKETRVRVRVDKTWRSPDGAVFGILLRRAGFAQ